MKDDIYTASRKISIILKKKGFNEESENIIDAIEYSSTATEILMKIRFFLKEIDINKNNFSIEEIDLVKEILNEINNHLK